MSANPEVVEHGSKCLRTPCYLAGQLVLGFVDGGATHTCVAKSWVEKMNLPIVEASGIFRQAVQGSEIPRIGRIENVTLENGSTPFQSIWR